MDLRRRELLLRTGGLSLAGLVAAAAPAARALGQGRLPGPVDRDAALQAFADTMLPGRKVDRTESGAPVAPGAIAGVHPLPGAVETDALALYRHPKVGFDALEPAFLADLQRRAGGDFVALGFDARTRVCLDGLSFDNPSRTLWEAAAAVPFTAFCAAALSEEQTAERAAGYRVMGLPGRNLRGYRRFSYGRRLSRERTRTGSLP
ncbi:MAG TPA: DUF5987 family protein [Solirubrobacteraceae bacterium]|jgi:hypothetical protein|nr:DUF5987 family protein [Solirubrobacteraceae bacterium]